MTDHFGNHNSEAEEGTDYSADSQRARRCQQVHFESMFLHYIPKRNRTRGRVGGGSRRAGWM